MSEQLEILTWKCDACAEAEGGSGLPCTLTSAFLPKKQTLCCPVSCEECEFEIVPTADNQQLIKDLVEGLEPFAKLHDLRPAPDGSSKEWYIFETKLKNCLSELAAAKALIERAGK